MFAYAACRCRAVVDRYQLLPWAEWRLLISAMPRRRAFQRRSLVDCHDARYMALKIIP